MMKKALLPTFVCLAMLTGLSSCQSGSQDDGKLTIHFWHTFGQGIVEEMNRKIDDFEKIILENEGVEVDIVLDYQGSYDDQMSKILKGFPTGNYPTIAVAYPDHVAQYLNAEGNNPGRYVVDLSKYINDPELGFGAQEYLLDGPVEDFVPTFYEEGSQYMREGIYSLPLMKSTEVMYYNKNVVAPIVADYTNGEVQDIDTYMNSLSWDEFMRLCDYVKTSPKAPKTMKWPAFYDSDANMFISQSYQQNIPFLSIKDGEPSVDFNNNQAKDMVSKFCDYYKDGLISTKGLEGEYGSNFFTSEEVLFDVGSSGGAGYQYPEAGTFEIGICKVPSANIKNPLYVTQGVTTTLLKTPDDKDGLKAEYGWKFLKYLTSTQVNTELCINGSEGYVPVRQSSYDTDLFKLFVEEGEFLGDVAEIVNTEIQGHYLNTPCFPGSATARDACGAIYAQVLLEGNSIDQAFADAENNTKANMK